MAQQEVLPTAYSRPVAGSSSYPVQPFSQLLPLLPQGEPPNQRAPSLMAFPASQAHRSFTSPASHHHSLLLGMHAAPEEGEGYEQPEVTKDPLCHAFPKGRCPCVRPWGHWTSTHIPHPRSDSMSPGEMSLKNRGRRIPEGPRRGSRIGEDRSHISFRELAGKPGRLGWEREQWRAEWGRRGVS